MPETASINYTVQCPTTPENIIEAMEVLVDSSYSVDGPVIWFTLLTDKNTIVECRLRPNYLKEVGVEIALTDRRKKKKTWFLERLVSPGADGGEIKQQPGRLGLTYKDRRRTNCIEHYWNEIAYLIAKYYGIEV